MNISAITFIWCGFLVLGFINGAFREIILKKIIKGPNARHLSALSAVLFFTMFLSFFWKKTEIHQYSDAAVAGLYWLVLTFLAETFLIGRLLGKQSWEQIFSNYNLLKGHLWPLVLIWITLMPLIFLIYNNL